MLKNIKIIFINLKNEINKKVDFEICFCYLNMIFSKSKKNIKKSKKCESWTIL